MQIRLFNLALDLIKSFSFEKNEKLFLENFPKKSKNYKKKQKEILIFIAQDYYHLIQTSYLINFSKYSNYKFMGCWGLDLNPQWKNKSKFIEFLIILKSKIITYFLHRKWRKLYESIGINDFIDLEKISRKEKKKIDLNTNKFMKKLKNKNLLNLKYENIQIGDLLIDTYIRYRNIPYYDINDLYFEQVLKKFLVFRHNTKKIIKQKKINKYISYFANYAHGIVCRTFLNSKIEVYCTADPVSYLKKLTKSSPNTITNYKNFKSKFLRVSNKPEKIKIAKIEFEKRFKGHIDKSFRYMKVSPYQKNSLKLNVRSKGVLFLHDFIDSPHHYGSMIFNSFWEWAVFTLELIKNNNLDISIKPHPNSLYQTKRFVEELKEKYSKLKWIDHRVSNSDIFKSNINFGISVYGTILLELAYHNIIPIASTRYHPYSDYNFVYTPKNLNNYKNLLLQSHKLKNKKNSKEKVKEFYYMRTFYNHDAIKDVGREIDLKDFKNIGSVALVNYLDKLKNIDLNYEQ